MKRVIIPANPKHTDQRKHFFAEIAIVLDDDIAAKYDVVAKEFPEDLPDFWVDPADNRKKHIRWISNFGLRKPDGMFEAKLPKGQHYQVEIPLAAGQIESSVTAAKIVYFDGKKVKELPGKFQGRVFVAELDLGDPPIGHTTG